MTLTCLLLLAVASAQEIVTRKDGTKVQLNPDNTWQLVKPSTSIPVSELTPEQALTVWDTTLIEDEHNYNRAVKLSLHYWNQTDKKVVGIKVKYDIKNAFDKLILSNTVEDEAVLEPSEKQRSTSFWVFPNNQFINNEPYDNLWQLAKNGTGKVQTKVLKVIFEDGTVLDAARGSKRKK